MDKENKPSVPEEEFERSIIEHLVILDEIYDLQAALRAREVQVLGHINMLRSWKQSAFPNQFSGLIGVEALGSPVQRPQ